MVSVACRYCKKVNPPNQMWVKGLIFCGFQCCKKFLIRHNNLFKGSGLSLENLA